MYIHLSKEAWYHNLFTHLRRPSHSWGDFCAADDASKTLYIYIYMCVCRRQKIVWGVVIHPMMGILTRAVNIYVYVYIYIYVYIIYIYMYIYIYVCIYICVGIIRVYIYNNELMTIPQYWQSLDHGSYNMCPTWRFDFIGILPPSHMEYPHLWDYMGYKPRIQFVGCKLQAKRLPQVFHDIKNGQNSCHLRLVRCNYLRKSTVDRLTAMLGFWKSPATEVPDACQYISRKFASM